MKSISAAKILLLLASLFFGLKNSGFLAQDLTLNEVRDKLLANPPVYVNSSIRRNCFSVLDEKLKSESAGWNLAIEDFYNGILENVVSDISNPCYGLAVIYKMVTSEAQLSFRKKLTIPEQQSLQPMIVSLFLE